jgi:hypothetical protein
MSEEAKGEQKEDAVRLIDDVQTLVDHLASMQFSDGTMGAEEMDQPPPGMAPNRYMKALVFLHHYRSGKAFATVDNILRSEWVTVVESDFSSMLRGADDINNFESEIVKAVYSRTRAAAHDETKVVSNSTKPMLAGGAEPAKLVRKQFDLVAEGAHLCPKTGPDCKTDTWIYVAAAALGLPTDDHGVLLKALRGSISAPRAGERAGDRDDEERDDAKIENKRAPPTMPSTGLNRSPFNLLYMMEQKYIFDMQSCVLALPIMSAIQAKTWKGTSYSVIVLCDDQKNKPGTAEVVAQSLRLTESVISVASEDDITSALDLLCSVLRFSAFCLDNMPSPHSPNGKKLWVRYQTQLENLRSYATNREGDSRAKSVLVPRLDLTGLGMRSIVKLDLQQENEGVAKVVFPDPMLLAFKSSTNWTRKFGFQLIAEAEAGFDDTFPPFDPRIEKRIDVHSIDDLSSLGSRSGR